MPLYHLVKHPRGKTLMFTERSADQFLSKLVLIHRCDRLSQLTVITLATCLANISDFSLPLGNIGLVFAAVALTQSRFIS